MPKLIYLGTPYTHADPLVREQRFKAVSRAAGWLMLKAGVHVYSPISMTHQMWLEMQDMPNTGFEWEFWANFDEFMVQKCEEFWILTIPGWEQSVGVTAETQIAKRLGLPIKYVTLLPDGTYSITDEP